MTEVTAATFVEIAAAEFTDKPFLSQFDIDMSSETVGNVYAIRITVDNKVGTAISDAVVFLLANVPDAPSPPSRVSDGSLLTIIMAPPAFDGGS